MNIFQHYFMYELPIRKGFCVFNSNLSSYGGGTGGTLPVTEKLCICTFQSC